MCIAVSVLSPTGALGAVSVVSESVSQSTRVHRPQAIQLRLRAPRYMFSPDHAVPVSMQRHAGNSCESNNSSCDRDSDRDSDSRGRDGIGRGSEQDRASAVVFSLKRVQSHEWASSTS
jgi:hypothetical protein